MNCSLEQVQKSVNEEITEKGQDQQKKAIYF